MKLRTLLFAGAIACAPAWGHQFHVGITDVSFNARTGSTEVVHTYMAHDAELLLANLYQRQFDLGDPADQAVLRKYIERQFWLQGANKARLPLQWVGMSADAESIVVYQEAPATPLAQAASIHDEVMTDFLADQVNTVNIKEGSSARTVTFDRAHPELALR